MNNIIHNLTQSFSNDYYFDLHLPRFTIPNGTKSNSFYIENTKEVYSNNHPTFNKDILYEIDNPLQIIAKNDSLICLDNTIILKELYKIISHIDLTNELLDFIETKSYPKKYFASFQSDTKEVQREMNKHKNIIVNARTHISNKGEARLNWWFYNMFSRNKKLAKFYLNTQLSHIKPSSF